MKCQALKIVLSQETVNYYIYVLNEGIIMAIDILYTGNLVEIAQYYTYAQLNLAVSIISMVTKKLYRSVLQVLSQIW